MAVKAQNFLECICAFHLSSYVDSPFKSFGGLMLIGPPGTLKTSFLNILEYYPDAHVVSDLNIKSLNMLRGSMASGRTRTLAITELRKLYERHTFTSSNLEGTLRALADEGFRASSHEDQRIHSLTSRCTIMSAMTEDFYRSHYTPWSDSGFLRRFCWALYRLDDPLILDRAIEEWKLIDFGDVRMIEPPHNGLIPNLTTEQDRRIISGWLKHQGDEHTVGTQVFSKVVSVLKWHYAKRKIDKDGMKVAREFAEMFQKGGGRVTI